MPIVLIRILNLSTFQNRISVAFRAFCLPALEGCVLDIGCGPLPVPTYLDGYDNALLAAIDPFGSADMHPFTFINAVAESIPWPNASFDRVIVATSLDHLLDLDLGLAEIARVLKTGGQTILWVGFVPGSPRYDPSSPETDKIDNFHLFHFDRPWFLQLMGKSFSCLEEINFDGSSHFFRFRKT